ncbi:Nramp family divalent metal transporter [Ascidiimonas aurantiaca]|uniref:Nramp family divalent metal transporter n=1 Tax=Ascidiimonas aurantiaca TaxID=1685432 RepID=UPI0030EBEE27
MIRFFRNLGPGTLVAAAFIGPGTVTVCTLAGANYGYTLLWTMVLAIIATVVLQEMAARLGLVTQKGLAEVISSQIPSPILRKGAIFLILVAIVLGNAAYEAGNIGGALLGLNAVSVGSLGSLGVLLIGGATFAILYSGSYRVLERSLITLVILMSISFVITAILTKPSWKDLFSGMLIPSIPEGSILTIAALVGTTIVPYNLFLHASLVREKWSSTDKLGEVRSDTRISIILGGLVSMSVIIAASALSGEQITGVEGLAKGLQPLFGDMAGIFLGIGLLSAGVTSAVTAPLAAAYVANSCFGWKASMKDYRFRLVWVSVLLLGMLSLLFHMKPIRVIQIAQIANGILLPVVAVFLLWVVNRPGVLGKFRNTPFQNLLAGSIVVLSILLGLRSVLKVTGVVS